MIEKHTLDDNLRTKYVKEVDSMIKNTPRDGEEGVKRYHDSILEKLDSGEVLDVPSFDHRNLHQSMWMMGYAIYNHRYDLDNVNLEFISKSEQRKRFDMWYAVKYILRRKLTEWELGIVLSASKSCEEVFHHPLEKLTQDELKI